MRPYTIGKLMSMINRLAQRELADMLKAHGIGGGGHHSYLKAILSHPGMNQDKLTAEIKLDKATTTRCIQQLVEAGYVRREVDAEDRRSYLLYPTERAVTFAPTLQRILDRYNQILTASLNEDEIRTLHGLLHKMFDGLNRDAAERTQA